MTGKASALDCLVNLTYALKRADDAGYPVSAERATPVNAGGVMRGFADVVQPAQAGFVGRSLRIHAPGGRVGVAIVGASHARRRAEALGFHDEGRLRGLECKTVHHTRTQGMDMSMGGNNGGHR